MANSLGTVYIYNSFRVLLFTMVSVLALAKAINSNSSTIVTAINKTSLFRGNWYITKKPFLISPKSGEANKPKYKDIKSPEVIQELLNMKNSAYIRKHVFVFNSDDFCFIKKYDSIVKCARDMNISHNTITKFIDTNKEYNGYIFSSHRVL